MKITEVINELQAILKNDGDIECCGYDKWGGNDISKIGGVCLVLDLPDGLYCMDKDKKWYKVNYCVSDNKVYCEPPPHKESDKKAYIC